MNYAIFNKQKALDSKRQSLSPGKTQSKRLKGEDTHILTGKMVKKIF